MMRSGDRDQDLKAHTTGTTREAGVARWLLGRGEGKQQVSWKIPAWQT